MLKKIAVFMVLFTLLFAFQSTAWAAAINAEDTNTATVDQVIRLEENPQLAMLNSNLDILPARGFGGVQVQPWFWVLSVVPGLGQLMMGNAMKGLIFFVAVALIYGSSFFLPDLINGVANGTGAIVSIVLYVLAGLVWAYNIWDAFVMSKRHSGMSSAEEQIKTAQELQEQLEAMIKFTQENKLVMQQGGAVLQHRISSF